MLNLGRALSAILSANLMAPIVLAQTNKPVDSVCIHQLEEAGPNTDTSPLGKHFLEETDLPQFALMGDIEKEFSMP